MEHLLEHYLYGFSANLRGFVFGFFHAAIMILGYYTGWSINRFLKIISNGKGILAADESNGTMTKRLQDVNVLSTPESIEFGIP